MRKEKNKMFKFYILSIFWFIINEITKISLLHVTLFFRLWNSLINKMFLLLCWCVLYLVIDYLNALHSMWRILGSWRSNVMNDSHVVLSCRAMWVVCLFKQSRFGAVILSWWFVCELVCLCTCGWFMITCLKMESWDHRHFPLHTADPVLLVSWTREKPRTCLWTYLLTFTKSFWCFTCT